MNYENIIALLKEEVLPTMGCTEPGAVALAAAYASEVFTSKIETVEVVVNPNIYKNGVAVGIPGTGETGLEIATALGVIKKHSEKQLSVLEGVTADELIAAKVMVASQCITVRVDETKASLWIYVKISGGSEVCEATIEDKHTNLVSLIHNGQVLLDQGKKMILKKSDCRSKVFDGTVGISELVVAVETMPIDSLAFLLEGVNMNMLAAERGIEKKLGMGIGAMYDQLIAKGMMADDVINYAKKLTAAAADARMSGENVKVMSSAGSGNHGITVILPVYAVASRLGIAEDRLIRAIAISHLVTIYVKMHTGHLSALCGCAVAAATGATAAIAWLIDGKESVIEAAMKNVIGNLTGMICDGGKVGCALKLATAATAATESAFLAQQNIVVPETNGIIGDTIEHTIENLGRVSNPGMLETDKIILNVMLAK